MKKSKERKESFVCDMYGADEGSVRAMIRDYKRWELGDE